MRWRRPLALAALAFALTIGVATAQQQKARTTPAPTPPPPVEAPPPVYEPQLLKLAEILGSLTHMADICRGEITASVPDPSGEAWRSRMRELIEAEAQSPSQKERFAGAFNRGFAGYQTTYRACTPSGRLALERLLEEGARLAQDLSSRFGT